MANRFFVNGGVDNNWGTTGNWSDTSGGAGGFSVPTASDAVFFDASSPNCTIDASARVALSLDFTGYTNTITFSQILTVSGSITLAAAMTFAGASALRVNATCTFTSNGKTVGVPLGFIGTGSVTTTLADDLTTGALLNLGDGNAATRTFNGNTLNIGAGVTVDGPGAGSFATAGTTVFKLTGTGTLTGDTANHKISNPLTIDAGGGTVTFSGASIAFGGVNLTYVSGTVVTTGSTIILDVGGTHDCSGMTWNNVQINGNGGVVLASNFNVGGTFTPNPNNNGTITLTGNLLNVAGMTVSGQSTGNKFVAGTTVITFNGTGTWSTSVPSTRITAPININTAGTLTISGTNNIGSGTLTYTAGTITGVSTPVIAVLASQTIDFNGGTLDASLSISGGGITVSLASGLTIATGRTFTLLGVSGASRASIQSTSGGTQRAFILTAGALTNIKFFNSTDMDSSGGQTVIWRAPGTLSNTINWAGAGGGSQGGGRGGGGGGTTQFRPTGATFVNIGNPGVSIIQN